MAVLLQRIISLYMSDSSTFTQHIFKMANSYSLNFLVCNFISVLGSDALRSVGQMSEPLAGIFLLSVSARILQSADPRGRDRQRPKEPTGNDWSSSGQRPASFATQMKQLNCFLAENSNWENNLRVVHVLRTIHDMVKEIYKG